MIKSNLRKYTIAISAQFKDLMQERDIYLKDKDIETITTIVENILSSEENKIIVIPASMGLGKSTLIEVILKYFICLGKDFGAIVVKERTEDLDRLVKNLGYWDNNNKIHACFALKGYSKDDCYMGYAIYDPANCKICTIDTCRVKTNFKKQANHPIVAITHKRLFLESNSKNCHDGYSQWKDFYGDNIKRSLLFIDERPTFFETKSLSRQGVEEFFEYLEDNLDKDLLTVLGESKQQIISIFREKQEGYIEPVKLDLSEHMESIERAWIKYSGSYPSLPNIFKSLSQDGAYRNVHTKSKKVTLQVAIVNDYDFTGYKTIIMDGTAKQDVSYRKLRNHAIMDLVNDRTYENLTIHHFNKKNLSQTRLKSTDFQDIIDLQPELERISSSGKTLMVCFQKNENKIKEILKDIVDISLDHFNNLKGKNSYNDCYNMVFLGTMHKPDEFYLQLALYINRGLVSSYDFPKNREGNVRKFPCDFVTEIMRNDKTLDYLQDIFRTAIRSISVKDDVNIYIWNTDSEIIDRIASALPGCKVTEWQPFPATRTFKDDFVDELKEIFQKPDTEEVSIKNHRDLIGCKKTIYSKYANDPDIYEELQQYGIVKSGHKWIRISHDEKKNLTPLDKEKIFRYGYI